MEPSLSRGALSGWIDAGRGASRWEGSREKAGDPSNGSTTWFAGLAFKAHRLFVSLNSRLESNKKEEKSVHTRADPLGPSGSSSSQHSTCRDVQRRRCEALSFGLRESQVGNQVSLNVPTWMSQHWKRRRITQLDGQVFILCGSSGAADGTASQMARKEPVCDSWRHPPTTLAETMSARRTPALPATEHRHPDTVGGLNLRTTTSQKCAAVPRRARI